VLVVACLRGSMLRWLPPVFPFVPSSFYGSIYPAAQNLLLALRAEGLGASLTTLPLWSATSARRALGLPFSVQPCCVIPIGWPLGRYGPTTRRPSDEVTHLDRFGNRPWQDS
jgi:nitroreductase